MKNIVRVITVAVAIYAFPFATIAEDSANGPKSFRLILILKRENGYRRMDLVVIRTKTEFDSFLAGVRKQRGWNNREWFESAIINAKVDFGKEALVLLRHTKGSGSVQVTFNNPIFRTRARKLMCRITRMKPKYGTWDMAYYCFALAVLNSAVSKVVLKVTDQKSLVLPIREKQSDKVGYLPPRQHLK